MQLEDFLPRMYFILQGAHSCFMMLLYSYKNMAVEYPADLLWGWKQHRRRRNINLTFISHCYFSPNPSPSPRWGEGWGEG